MSDIDEIALETVKAIGNIDPDKLPGGRTQAVAQAQILVRDAINREVQALKAANQDFQGWLNGAKATAWLLRKQAEAVEAATKATEIKSATDDSKCYSPALRDYAQRLRQQANEIEKGASE